MIDKLKHELENYKNRNHDLSMDNIQLTDLHQYQNKPNSLDQSLDKQLKRDCLEKDQLLLWKDQELKELQLDNERLM